MRPTPIAAALLILAASPGAALAQRNGNEQNGLNYQPSAGQVEPKERAAGVAPPPQVQQQQTHEVDSIYRNLMTKERGDGMTAAPANPAARVPNQTPR